MTSLMKVETVSTGMKHLMIKKELGRAVGAVGGLAIFGRSIKMATYTKRGDAYLIRTSEGSDSSGTRKRLSMTWRPDPGMSDAQIKKELQRQMVLFEENAGEIVTNAGNITFQQFAEKWLNEYEVDQLKKKTFHDYKVALETRIIPEIGKVKLSRITPQFLLSFYKKLLNGDAGKRKYEAKPDLLKYMKSQKITRVSVSDGSGLAIGTVSKAVKCIRIDEISAQKICDYLQLDLNKYFKLVSGKKGLAPSSISKYHGIISSMMTGAYPFTPSHERVDLDSKRS